jgi:hypothetical protein
MKIVQWFEDLSLSLSKEQPQNLDAFVDVLVASLEKDRSFLPLASISTSVIEKGASKDCLVSYKQTVGELVNKLAARAAVVMEMDQKIVAVKLIDLWACFIGFYQLSQVPESVKDENVMKTYEFLAPEFKRRVAYVTKMFFENTYQA